MLETLSTRNVSAHERWAYWADMVCETYVRLGCDGSGGRNFAGEIRRTRLGRSRISWAAADAHTLIRSRRHIALAGENDMLVSVQLGGETGLSQDGRDVHLVTGDFALYDASRQYRLHFPNRIRQLVLQVPRDELVARLGRPEAYCARAVRRKSGFARLLVAYLSASRTVVDSVSPSQRLEIERHTLDLLSWGLSRATGLPSTNPELSDARYLALLQVKQQIDQCLRDPGLNIQQVARAIGRSARDINRLLAEEGPSFSTYVRDRRLNRCRQDLDDPAHRHRSISQIAYFWGFNDAAYFSRAFRNKYQTSPREYRNRNQP